jgi:hypothetical protein
MSSVEFARLKMAGNTQQKKNCTKGWSCGYTCLGRDKKTCNSPLQGQVAKYADWLEQQAGGSAKTKPSSAPPTAKKAPKPATPAPSAEPQKADKPKPIKDSREFSRVATDVLSRLSRDYNMDSLVPAYRLRESLGDRVSKQDFDKWSLEMESSGKIQIMEDSVEDNAPSKIDAGIEVRGKKKTYIKVLESTPPDSLGSSPEELERKSRLPKKEQINNYGDFESAASQKLAELDPQGEGFVPVYKLRRALGDRVTRKEFSDLLFEMQSKDQVQLTEGTVEDNERTKLEDSVQSKLGKIRAYVKFTPKSNFSEVEIEILPQGTHTSSGGFKLPVSAADLDEVVASYNPATFAAPLIISHDTQGISDRELGNSEFAFGVPKSLKRVGDRVKAIFDKVAPEFEAWVKQGKLTAVSPSFYLPNSPHNPTPGKLALRHIAALGRTPPAIKGMQSLQSAFNFSESQEGVVDFSFALKPGTLEFGGSDRAVARLLQNLREWLISEYDLETADRALPGPEVGILAESDDYWLYRRIDELENRLQALERPVDAHSPTYQETAMTTTLEEREAQLAERERQILFKECLNFCETELKGRLIPAIAPTSDVANFMAWLASQEGEINFGEGSGEVAPLQWFKGFLSRLPNQISLGQHDMGDVPNFSEQTNADEQKAKDAYANAYKSVAVAD